MAISQKLGGVGIKTIGVITVVLWISAIITMCLKDKEVEILQLNAMENEINEEIENGVNEGMIDNERRMDKYPFLLKLMVNQLTGKTVRCNPMKYKYFRLLITSLHSYFNILNKTRTKTTTNDIDNDMDRWCHSDDDHHHSLEFMRKQRIQIIDNKMYISNNRYYKYGKDNEGYTTSILLYLKGLMNKYSLSIDNTDLIWHYHDVKLRWRYFKPYHWRNNGTIPYFFTDADIVWNDNDDVSNILFGVSRNYMKYRYFGDIAYKDWKIYKDESQESDEGNIKNSVLNNLNYLRINDYLEYKEIMEDKNNLKLLNWSNKPYNKALFVGGAAGKIRPKFFNIMLNDSYIYNLTKNYFNITHSNHGFGIVEQLKFKYIIILNGNSVRDGFLYQLGFHSVILKQLTSIYEFWLFDLENNKHVIFFENILHLISIVTNMVDQVNGYYVNTKINSDQTQKQFEYLRRNDIVHRSQYNPERLKEIANNAHLFMKEYLNEQSVDCYMINMLRLYNHYLFDTDSIQKSSLSQCPMHELILDD